MHEVLSIRPQYKPPFFPPPQRQTYKYQYRPYYISLLNSLAQTQQLLNPTHPE